MQTKERVHDWVQNVSSQFSFGGDGGNKTGRINRAKSQDRTSQMSARGGYGGGMGPMPPTATTGVGGASNNNGGGGGGAGYNLNQFYGGPVQPNLLEARLLQHQQSRMNNNNMSLMAPPAAAPTPSGGAKGINMSLPATSGGAGMDYHADEVTEFTTAVYKFPQEREDMPYRVKIPGKSVTLRHVKEYMPKKGAFRYYFKTEIDGEVCFEEETDERAKVPLFQAKIIVQCRND